MRRTGSTSSSALVLLQAALFAACASAAGPGGGPEPAAPTAEITRILQASADAWNRGDVDGFLLPYHRSPELSFVGSDDIVRGFSALRARYQGGYFDSGLPPRLRFTDLEVRPLGESNALMLGRYTLEDRSGGAVTSTGIFTLVWGRTPDGWRILHDHTSETGPR